MTGQELLQKIQAYYGAQYEAEARTDIAALIRRKVDADKYDAAYRAVKECHSQKWGLPDVCAIRGALEKYTAETGEVFRKPTEIAPPELPVLTEEEKREAAEVLARVSEMLRGKVVAL